MFRALCAIVLGFLVAPAALPAGTPAASGLQDEGAGDAELSVPDLVSKLKRGGDLADPQLVQELAGRRTREALEGLLDAYRSMNTIWMQREIVRSLHQFDGVADAELPALQKLIDVATQSPEPELREAAIDGLGQCRSQGKNFLKLIVESPAEDAVRERAMENHLGLADESDHAWYRELYGRKPSGDDGGARKEHKDRRRRKKAEDEPPPEKPVHSLNTIRAMAFDAIKSELTPDELEQAVHDGYPEIRASALRELEARGEKRVLDLAEEMLKKDGKADNRVLAAQVIARISGTKVARDFIKRAMNVDTPMALRRGLAEILVGFQDPMVNRQLVAEIGKGCTHEKLFTLWAVRGIEDDKVGKAVQKLLGDKDPEVVVAACRALAERKDATAVPALERLVEKSREKAVVRAALDALTVLRAGDAEWMDRLVAMTKNEDPELRNLALDALGNASDPRSLGKLVEALQDPNWSTRLAALGALEHQRSKEAVDAIIARMPSEEGRLLEEFGQALFRLTGQPYDDNAKGWAAWWKEGRERFHFPTEEELRKIKRSEQEWRLKQATRVETKFFGIRIVSRKVLFVIDVSGSMAEESLGEYEGKTGLTRMDIAKAEIMKAIESLDEAAFFNVIIFSGDSSWMVEGSLLAANEKNRAEAIEFVSRLGAFGGTNLYGALRDAFKDPDADTIFVMSDGEPSVGDEVDPLVIREHVQQWNEHRGIVINTVSIGGKFDVLEWLAEDSGGKHVKYE